MDPHGHFKKPTKSNNISLSPSLPTHAPGGVDGRVHAHVPRADVHDQGPVLEEEQPKLGVMNTHRPRVHLSQRWRRRQQRRHCSRRRRWFWPPARAHAELIYNAIVLLCSRSKYHTDIKTAAVEQQLLPMLRAYISMSDDPDMQTKLLPRLLDLVRGAQAETWLGFSLSSDLTYWARLIGIEGQSDHAFGRSGTRFVQQCKAQGQEEPSSAPPHAAAPVPASDRLQT